MRFRMAQGKSELEMMTLHPYLRESALIEEHIAEEIAGAPVLATESGRIGAGGYRLLEGEPDGSQRVRQAIVR